MRVTSQVQRPKSRFVQTVLGLATIDVLMKYQNLFTGSGGELLKRWSTAEGLDRHLQWERMGAWGWWRQISFLTLLLRFIWMPLRLEHEKKEQMLSERVKLRCLGISTSPVLSQVHVMPQSLLVMLCYTLLHSVPRLQLYISFKHITPL